MTFNAADDATPERPSAGAPPEEVARRVEQLEALYALADALPRSQSAEDVFTASLQAIRRALRCPRAAVLLCDRAGVMRFVASEGLSAPYRAHAEGHSPWRETETHPMPVVIGDALAAELPTDLAGAIRQEGIRALAFIPLVSGDRLIGKFMAYSDTPRVFSEDELQIGLTIARHLTFALDRRAAEQALRESEARYRAVVEGQGEMLCRFRSDGTILFVNGAYARARNSTPEALTGANFWSFIPADEHTTVRAMLDQLTPEAPEVRVENRFEMGDGPHWTMWTNRALAFDAFGRWTEAQSTGMDITERKRAEEKFRRSHETFFNLIHNAPFGIYVVDAAFRLIEVSAGSQRVFSSIQPLLGRDFAEVLRTIWPEPHASRFIALFRHTLATGEPFHAPNSTQRRADTGELESYDWQIERITLPDGQFGVVSYFYDMTARRAAEEALRANEERYRSIVAVITDVPWITDASGRFVTPQPAWARYTGQTWEEHRDFGWINALHPEDRERLRREWELGRGRALRFESRGRFWHAATQTWRHFVVKAAPRLREDGTVLEWVGSCTDQEGEIRAAQELKQARDEAVAANRAKDEFLATLSHELRTPLNPVLLIASDAAEDTTLPEHVRRDFRLIADNIGLEARLIDDLLDLNRITRGKVVLETRELDVHAVLHDAIATVADDIAEKGITLSMRLRATHPIVAGDPVRLRQVFWNVLKNAVKFTPAGGEIEVATEASEPPRDLTIRIRDTGIGMTEDEVARVFQPFVQGTHAARGSGSEFGGLGLGLAISRALVTAHGGEIAVESPGPDQGSTILIRLTTVPSTATSPSAPPPGRVAEDPRPTEAPLRAAPPGRARILFVEDHDATRATLSGLLARRGYAVTAAGSLTEARERARESAFDILVSDLGLPDGDGCLLLDELRKLRPGLTGVALSGYGMDSDRQRSAAAGFSHHLTKPVDIQALERVLRSVFQPTS